MVYAMAVVMKKEDKRSGIPASGRKALRITTLLAVVFGIVFSCLFVVLAFRLNEVLTWEIPVNRSLRVSERTRGILAETQGAIRVTCFMDRRHPMFRPISRLLRGLRHAARTVAGAEIQIEYVDPRWDLPRATRLAGQGVPENALVFSHRRRRVVVTLDDMLTSKSVLRTAERNGDDGTPSGRGGNILGVFRGETACAAAIARLSLPAERMAAYWLQGHGEASFGDYNARTGFSDITRELVRGGFEVRPLLLPGKKEVPSDCGVLLIVGARNSFAKEELRLLEVFLRRGGRMLCLLTPGTETGLEGIFEHWGIRVTPYIGVSPATLTGRDVVATVFGDHVISRGLASSSVIFGAPACLQAVESASGGEDRPKVSLLLQTGADGWGESTPAGVPRTFDPASDLAGPVAFAAVSEQGANVAKDVVFRPTRLCVIGESDFLTNGLLASRANANRDFFMNAVSWIAGIDAGGAPSLGGDAVLVTGLTRKGWIGLMAAAAAGFPALVLLIFLAVAFKRRG